MRKIAILTLAFFLVSIFSSLSNSIHLTPYYSYANESFTVPLRFQDVYEPVASLSHNHPRLQYRRATGSQSFIANKNMFVLRLPRTFTLTDPSDIRITLTTTNKKIPLEIDSDGKDQP